MNSDELIKFKSLVSDLYAHYSESDELDELIDEIFNKAMKLKSDDITYPQNALVCPHCRAELKPTYYRGYYDEFPHWECNCYDETEPFISNIKMGAYA